MKNLYIFVGPPGSGKGTQASLLYKKFKIKSFSPGEILRQEIKKKTKFAKQIKPIMEKGELVAEDKVADIIIEKLGRLRSSIILDGFPRSVYQAKRLDDYFQKNTGKYNVIVFEYKLTEKQILSRIAGRRHCECGEIYHVDFRPPKISNLCDKCKRKLVIRADSRLDIVKNRIKVYKKGTMPIVRFFKQRKFYKYHSIDASQSIEKVFQATIKIIK